jgi:hypothetical protein
MDINAQRCPVSQLGNVFIDTRREARKSALIWKMIRLSGLKALQTVTCIAQLFPNDNFGHKI